MANLSYAQLEGIWLQAAAGTKYATQTWAALMAAIAEAESGGNPAATNPTDNHGTQTSWGLWQISTGNHAEPSPNWNNPLINAQLALAKLQNPDGLDNWGTYTSGAYKAFLSGSTTPDTSGITDATLLAATSASAAGSASQAADANECAWSIGWGGIPGTSWLTYLNPFASSNGNVGSGSVCLISKSQVRGIAGVGFIVGGGVLLLAGLNVTLVGAGISAATRLVPSLGPTRMAGRFARTAATSAAA